MVWIKAQLKWQYANYISVLILSPLFISSVVKHPQIPWFRITFKLYFYVRAIKAFISSCI